MTTLAPGDVGGGISVAGRRVSGLVLCGATTSAVATVAQYAICRVRISLTCFSRREQHLLSFATTSASSEKSLGSEVAIRMVTNLVVNAISSQPGAANERKCKTLS